ncbi:MAG TPA: ATP-binding protein [Armatimonadota bacterium]
MSLIQVILLATVLYNLALAGLILVRTRTNQAGRNFAWYILGNAAWQACIVLMQPRYGETFTLWLVRGTFFCAIFFGVAWMLFCAEFPQTSERFLKVVWVMAILSLPWFFLCWTPWMIPAPIKFMDGWVSAQSGPLVAPFALWMQAWPIAGALHLFFKTKRLRGIERLQVRYILLGAVSLIIIGTIINLILPVISHSTQYSFYGPLASLFVTTTTTYAIVRYRLMDIRIVLRAGLIYSITIGLLTFVFALLVPVLNSAFTTHFHTWPQTGSFIMAFLMALAFQPLRRYVQHHVDLIFFKSVYDYRVTLREAGSALASARDRELLVETLTNALARTLRPRGIAVYLPGNDDALTQVSCTGVWDELPKTLSDYDPVLRYAVEIDEVLLAEELIRQTNIQHTLGERMKGLGIYVALPMIAGDRLCGMVFLGEKLSGDVYTSDDVGLLRILGKQAAIALDNARHYDEIMQMNEYHQRLLNIMQDGVVALDPKQRIITFNPAAERITGVPAHQAQGKRLEDLGITQLPTHDSGGRAVETTLATQSGQEVPVLVTVTPFLRRWEVAESHLIVFRDLSTLRALEMEKMQAERFSSMGAMAASLAHEIKNPLVPIQTFAHLLPLRYDDSEFREEFSQTVVKEVERINRLVGQMLDLVRKPSHDRSPVDVCEVIERLLVLLRPECDRLGVEIRTNFTSQLPMVVGVAGQIYQAILNVLTNAVQAMPNGGALAIDVYDDGHNLICRICDTGPGVAQDALPRIFEPLFTTKSGGHGLGLALTYQFVRSHGGEIRAECPPDQGLVIIMALPAWRRAEAELLCS